MAATTPTGNAYRWNFMGVHRMWTVLLFVGCLVLIPTGIALATRKSGWGYFFIIVCILALVTALVVTERARVRYLEDSLYSAQTLVKSAEEDRKQRDEKMKHAREMWEIQGGREGR